MRIKPLPQIKVLQDQTGRVLWYGDENCMSAPFDCSSFKDGDELFYFYPDTGKKTRMGFLVKEQGVLKYYKESARPYVTKPRWWWSQIRAKPGETAICVGGKKNKESIDDRQRVGENA